MRQLLRPRNMRRRQFARLIFNGTDIREAYAQVGWSRDNGNPWRYMRRLEVQKELRRLEARAMKKADITTDSILERLDESYNVARDKENSPAMTTAAMSMAKLCGLIVDKRENVDVNKMSKDELRDLVKQEFGSDAPAMLAILDRAPIRAEPAKPNIEGPDTVQ